MFQSSTGFLMGGGSGFQAQSEEIPFTQNFSMDTQPTSSPQSDTPQKSKPPTQVLLPVTLRMITEHAVTNETSKEVTIHGQPVLSCLSVCQVITAEKKNASFEFFVTDTSAKCKVLYYYDSDDIEMVESLEALKPMDYIRVVGQARITPEPAISAVALAKVTDHDEVPFHLIEAVTVAMKLTHPDLAARLVEDVPAQNENASFNTMMTPTPVSKPQAQVQTPMEGGTSKISLPSPPKLEEKVKKWLADNHREEGFTFPQIADGCKVSLSDIAQLLDDLLEAGELQTTVDEEHVSLLD
eukprot:GEMP01046815.1.p1 GENE.GEMP01046815.1~~GEMP01046815.1.p1  ORF type:complete len:297 (+),score=71.36 GEMP01046815.1:127-1017(+)